jgi:outer membrane biosynthesis protein TonB
MRIVEIASAEEQLALWKLISDNVWTTISQQARTEAQQRAAAAAKSRLKPKKPKKLKKPPRAPAPPKPKPKPQNKSAVPARPQTVNQPAKTQPRSSPLPTRQPPLPSSQPVLPAIRSSTFSQADLNRIQTGMTSPSGFNTGSGLPA